MRRTIFLALLAAGTLAAEAEAQFSGFYKIQNRNSGKAAVVQSASTADGAAVLQWTYGGSSTNDEWELVGVGSGFFRIMNRNSGKALTVQSASTADGAAVVQWTYGGASTNDEWQPIDIGGGFYRIMNRHSGKALAVPSASTADGAAVVQWTYGGASTNDEWSITSVGSGGGGGTGIGAIVSAAQFDQIWSPSTRSSTYTYADFVSAANTYYPALCGTGDTNMKKRECAAYFANKNQETGSGRYDRELYCQPGGGGYGSAGCNYCSGSSGCGACAGGQQYWGRHSIQLSWNGNYCAAQGVVGNSLHSSPNNILSNKALGWRVADWYWMTQLGPGVSNGYGTWPQESAHAAITTTDGSGNYGFGGTIRAINGGIECGSRVQQQINRVTFYNGSGSASDEDGSGGVLGILGYSGGAFGRRYCSP
jgi:chitinase